MKKIFKKNNYVAKTKPAGPKLEIRFINRFNRADYDDGISTGKLVAVADFVY